MMGDLGGNSAMTAVYDLLFSRPFLAARAVTSLPVDIG
jgi:hypothetical protein